MVAKVTATEIKTPNDYERKWKIKTNDTKFQIIPINRKKLERANVGDRTYVLKRRQSPWSIIDKQRIRSTLPKQN